MELILLSVVLMIYFLPTLVASGNGHHNSGAIFVLNLLLGWTFVGWALSLVWACTATERGRRTGQHLGQDRGQDAMVALTRPPPIPLTPRRDFPTGATIAAVLLLVGLFFGGVVLSNATREGDLTRWETPADAATDTGAAPAEPPAVTYAVSEQTLGRPAYACRTGEQVRELTSVFGPGRQVAFAEAVLIAIARKECRSYARGTALVVKLREPDAIAEVWERGAAATWFMGREFLGDAPRGQEPARAGPRLETAALSDGARLRLDGARPRVPQKPRPKVEYAHRFACRDSGKLRILLDLYDPARPQRWVTPLTNAIDDGACAYVRDARPLRVVERAEPGIARVSGLGEGAWWTAAEVVGE